MHKPIIKFFLILILMLSQLQTVYAINLGRVIYDSETPDIPIPPTDEPTWEEQLNEEDNNQLTTLLNNEQDSSDLAANNNEPENNADPAPELTPAQDKQPEADTPEEPAKVVTIVKHVYEPLPDQTKVTEKDIESDNSDKADVEQESRLLQVSAIRDTVQPIVDQLSTKVTDLESKVEATGTTLQNIILIVLVVVLCLLTLRIEVRFQRLADKYDHLKKIKNSNK